MSITLAEMHILVKSTPGVRARTAAACLVAAYSVLWEDIGTENHVARVQWANNALLNCESIAEKMLGLIAVSNTDVQAGDSVTDAQLQSAVNGAIGIYIKLFQ